MGSVATLTIVSKGKTKARYTPGKISASSETYNKPGYLFYQTAEDTYAKYSDGVYNSPVFLEFNKHTTSTFGEHGIDDYELVSRDQEFLIPSSEIEWWARVKDLSAHKYGGTPLRGASNGVLAEWSASYVVHARIAFGYKYSSGDTVVKVTGP